MSRAVEAVDRDHDLVADGEQDYSGGSDVGVGQGVENLVVQVAPVLGSDAERDVLDAPALRVVRPRFGLPLGRVYVGSRRPRGHGGV